jgi:LPPG:FO 2-phospho-L-lactate transferase
MNDGPVTILTGGVGGAKLVAGLTSCLSRDVTAIVNTGDDFEHLGLPVSPDIDTLLYTLAGKANPAQGWGRIDETWNFMTALAELGAETWFQLGDGDLALHVLRGLALATGDRLSTITARFARAWNIATTVLPMSDDVIATELDTDHGLLAFQRYFVDLRCTPAVRAIRFVGATAAVPAPGVLDAILRADNRAIVIAPSNPFLSIDPILAVPGIREALAAAPAPVIAVSPLVGGAAVKGPTDKLMRELGLPISAAAIASHYEGVIDALLIDERDPPGDPGIASARADTLMTDPASRSRVAGEVLALAATVGRR